MTGLYTHIRRYGHWRSPWQWWKVDGRSAKVGTPSPTSSSISWSPKCDKAATNPRTFLPTHPVPRHSDVDSALARTVALGEVSSAKHTYLREEVEKRTNTARLRSRMGQQHVNVQSTHTTTCTQQRWSQGRARLQGQRLLIPSHPLSSLLITSRHFSARLFDLHVITQPRIEG